MSPPSTQQPKAARCSHCEDKDYCDQHILVLSQLETIKNIPTTVSRLSGTLAILGVLILSAVGIIFNSHIEAKKTAEIYSDKIDNLSSQISKLENETNKSIYGLKSDMTRLAVNIEQLQKDSNRRYTSERDKDRDRDNKNNN